MPAWIFSGVFSFLLQCSINYIASRWEYLKNVWKCVWRVLASCPLTTCDTLQHTCWPWTGDNCWSRKKGWSDATTLYVEDNHTLDYNLLQLKIYTFACIIFVIFQTWMSWCCRVFTREFVLVQFHLELTQSKKACGATALRVSNCSEFSCLCLLECRRPGLLLKAAVFLIQFRSQFSFSNSVHFTDVLLLRSRRFMIRLDSVAENDCSK